MTHRLRAATLAGTLLLLLVAAGCGGGDESGDVFTGVPLELQDPGPVHVHGLGYDTDSGTLYIATHTGMFELPAAAATAVRIGDRHQDTMGFTLVEPGRFLGSGHPDARDSLPSRLGLIESTDRGRSWRTLSLSGEADFHVLRARGTNVYGFDVAGERLLASSDGGRTWAERAAPEHLVDLAIDPGDPEHLLASGGAVLYRSVDAGRSWSPVASGVSGHLAWPVPRRLFVAPVDGALLTATCAEGPWQARGSLGGEVAALHAAGGLALYAALHDGTIKQSDDGGTTWQVRATP
ncbi:MAG TPA: hypothetical protein VLS46_00240 [Gaiellaceae bacterium]|nr:hypothetical protein [Gaiellaceae bacterium]